MKITNDLKHILLTVFIGIGFALASALSMDIFITLILLSISVFLFLFGLKSKFDLLLKTLSVFILFHLIIFPYIYVILIKLDSNAFLIDNLITENELKIAQNEIQDKYDIKLMHINKRVALEILEIDDSLLDSNLHYINNDNIQFIDSFLLHKTAIYRKLGHPSAGYATLAICDLNGKYITNFVGEYGNKISDDLTLREFLNNKLERIKKINSKLQQENEKIEKKEIWTYKTVLAYSINIFDTDNIKPKTKLSNVLFFIHKFFVAIFSLGIIGTSFYEFIIEKRTV